MLTIDELIPLSQGQLTRDGDRVWWRGQDLNLGGGVALDFHDWRSSVDPTFRHEPSPPPEPDNTEWIAAQHDLEQLERRRAFLADMAADPNPVIAAAARRERRDRDPEYQEARMAAAKILGGRARASRTGKAERCKGCP